MDCAMSERAPFRICLVGLPATGKTTYIAALWAYLTSGLPDGRYRVTAFPDDPSYLNEIATAWAAGRDMPRNSLGTTDRIEFTIETPDRAEITVVLPDLAGEVFLNAIIRPWIAEDVAEAVTSSDLLLLFVNGEKAKTYAALGDHEVPQGEGGGLPSIARPAAVTTQDTSATDAVTVQIGLGLAPFSDFVVEDLDSDTLNTELLQRLLYLTQDNGPPPIAIVVSAWDVPDGNGDTPRFGYAANSPLSAFK